MFAEAGEAYLALTRRCITEAHADHKTPIAERCDETAYNSGRAFLAAKKLERAQDAARLMIDPANGMKGSQLTTKLVKLVKEP